MYDEKIRALRMERQHLLTPANETEYDALYRDLQPGQNVSSKGALRAATSAGSCPKTSSFSQRCTASRSKTRR